MKGEDYRKIKDGLADIGTLAHLLIMNHLNGSKPDTSDFSQNDIAQAENCFLSYLEWEKHHTIKPILVEKPMVSDQYFYGGTPDCLCILDGKRELLDFKTGKAIYPEAFYQIGAYSQLVKEQGYDIDQARILRIGRDADEGFEERIMRSFDLEFLIFTHCLSIYHLQKEIKRQ